MIRPANAGDAEPVAGLLSLLGYVVAVNDVRARLTHLADARHDAILLAPPAAGLVAVHRVPLLAEGGALARITALVVAPDQRRSGVGARLLRAAETSAVAWGCTLVEVSSGRRPERAAAHRFYPAAGYTDAADRSVRYWKRLP